MKVQLKKIIGSQPGISYSSQLHEFVIFFLMLINIIVFRRNND